MTIHIWGQNWNIYDPAKPDSTLSKSIQYAVNYIEDHEKIANKLVKFGVRRVWDFERWK
ncbi:hypothetical protein KK060_08845 [Fulvivirgaceae bacterium PWU20]|uniref:Glycoside hydrolase family 5 domain-containing protein n=1 Tax=Chryseosolibacter indicus TaxID=2782351 RepID=A0ABS5VRJ1_9BACT|nr:hypothetical protein [Chryseosolibacter indicus]